LLWGDTETNGEQLLWGDSYMPVDDGR
jgi:hypothetical protein